MSKFGGQDRKVIQYRYGNYPEFAVSTKVMPCGACARNRERRRKQLEQRRLRQQQKEQEKIARAAAAQAKMRAENNQ